MFKHRVAVVQMSPNNIGATDLPPNELRRSIKQCSSTFTYFARKVGQSLDSLL